MDDLIEPLFVETIPLDALEPLRRKYWERFRELGLPGPKQEAYQYVPLRKWLGLGLRALRKGGVKKETIIPYLLPECHNSYLVFVNGYFEESLSDLSGLPSTCVRLNLDAAMKTYGLVLQNRLSKDLREESDGFAALNGAFHGRGVFLYLPPKVELSKPIQVISLLSSTGWMAPRLQIFLGKQAKMEIVHTTAAIGMSRAIGLVDAVLDEGAQLCIADTTDAADKSWVFHNLRASLKRDARLKHFCFSEGGATIRHSLKVALCEEGAEAELKGLDYLANASEAHTHVLVEHRAPHCRSRQHYKKALQDKSRSSFEGKIFVHPIAQKTEAYQFNQNLLLSDEAAAHAKPNLEIFADDVKASHGATFAQFESEEIFYLRARGLSALDAKALLLEGFCREMIDCIEIPGIRKQIRKKMGL